MRLNWNVALTIILDSTAVMVDNDHLLYVAENEDGFSITFEAADKEVAFNEDDNVTVKVTEFGFIFTGDNDQEYLIEVLTKKAL